MNPADGDGLPPITPERWRDHFSWKDGDFTIIKAAAAENRPGSLSDADQERFDQERFKLQREFCEREHRPPTADELREICRQAGETTGVPAPTPLPLVPDEDGELL